MRETPSKITVREHSRDTSKGLDRVKLSIQRGPLGSFDREHGELLAKLWNDHHSQPVNTELQRLKLLLDDYNSTLKKEIHNNSVIGIENGRLKREVDELKAKLKNVVSHATGGAVQDINLPLNELCVRITQRSNEIYQAGSVGLSDENIGQKEQRYATLIWDAARDLAVTHKGDTLGMGVALSGMGVSQVLITPVLNAMQAPDYEEVDYRGDKVDERVIECLKDCLREVHKEVLYGTPVHP
jgi:hypothetical protein